MLDIVRKLYAIWRAAALREVLEIQELMRLLMKPRNTHTPWTSEEKVELVGRLKSLSKTVPMLLLFSLPGGSLLLPLFAFVLDRRRTRRIATAAAVVGTPVNVEEPPSGEPSGRTRY